MKRFNFSKRNQEKYQKKNEMYVNSLNDKLKILNGATSSKNTSNNNTNKNRTNSQNRIKPEIIGKSRVKNDIVDEITKDSEKNVINDFSKNLDGVFDELKQIRENPKVKNTPKEIIKSLKNKKNNVVRNIGRAIERKKKA